MAEVALKEWRGLFEQAQRYFQLAPWRWMADSDLFGVQDPESGEIGYMAVLGKLGEEFGLLVYLGRDGLDTYLKLQAGGAEELDWDLVAKQRCLQLFFEDRKELTPRDLALLQRLGLKFRGKKAWPVFRSQRPGYEAWYLEAHEVRYFTHALAQTCEVAERFREDPELLGVDEDLFVLVRVPLDGEGRAWENRRLPLPPPPPLPRAETIPHETLASLAREDRPRQGIWEVDVFAVPALVREVKNSPSMFMSTVLCVHQASGFVLALHVQPFSQRFTDLARHVSAALANAALPWPQEVWVKRPELVAVLSPLLGPLGIDLVLTSFLPALEEAQESLSAWLQGEA